MWLEKQAVDGHDGGYDAESAASAAAARDKDELASYDQTSAADIGIIASIIINHHHHHLIPKHMTIK